MPAPYDVVAFGAHPDDAEAACGGLLALLMRQGYSVAIADLTRGERASNGTPAEREGEARQAAAVLGVERFNLALPDGGLCADDASQLLALVQALRTFQPRLILVPDRAARHPDHVAATELLVKARFWCGAAGYVPESPPARRPVLVRCLDFHPMQPSFVVDVTETLEIKLQALRCYRSQFERAPGRLGTLLNDPAYLQRVETNARAYGQLIGSQAGEPYGVDGPLPVRDPVALWASAERNWAP